MVTSGEAGIDGMEPEECRRVREAEEIESARIVGVSTVEFLHQPDGVRDAGNRWVFNDQLVDGLEHWGGVRQIWEAASPAAKHGVDTTDTFDAGVASLAAHKAYIDGLGWENFDPREFLEGFGRQIGQRLRTTFGAVFGVYPMTWGGDED